MGIKVENLIYNLRGTYSVLDGYNGGQVAGGTYLGSSIIQNSRSVQTESDDVFNDILQDAAAQIVEAMNKKIASIPRSSAENKVLVTIASYVKDLDGHELSLPDIRLTEGKAVRNEDSFPALLSANVSVDGFAVGATPVNLKLFPGPHKLELTRPGFQSVQLNFIAQDGVVLSPSMWLSNEGFSRWKEIRDFLQALDTKRALTAAQVKVMEGYAQELRQSGYLVEVKSNQKIDQHQDIKVDTKEGIRNYFGSIYDFWHRR